MADFDRAIELDPRNVEARLNRGNLWHDKGRFEEAIMSTLRNQPEENR